MRSTFLAQSSLAFSGLVQGVSFLSDSLPRMGVLYAAGQGDPKHL